MALVGREEVTKAEVQEMIDEFRAVNRAEHRPFPAPGTSAYKAFQDDAVNYFVQAAVFEQQARRQLGIVVTQKEVEQSIARIRDHAFGGSEARMIRHFRSLGIDRKQLERFQRLQLAEEKLPGVLAARAHLAVSTTEAWHYYEQHRGRYGGLSFREAKRSIIDTLLARKTDALVRSWVAEIVHTTCGEIHYQVGYHPDNLACEST